MRSALIRIGVAIAAMLVVSLAPARTAAGSVVIPIYGESAYCNGVAVAPTGSTYALQSGCVLNLQIRWPDGLVSAHPQASREGVDWFDLSFAADFGPAWISGVGFAPCSDLGDGVWSFRARGTDAAGETALSEPFPYTVSCAGIDRTPPTITAAATSGGDPYVGGTWTNQPVVVHFACTDADSGVAWVAGDTTLAGEGAGMTVTGECHDNAGNAALVVFANIQIDRTPPLLAATATADGASYTGGTWTNRDVVVHFDCTDGLSGVASAPADETVTGDGAGRSATGTCLDAAGNSATATFADIRIDETPPTVAYLGDAGTYTVDQQVAIACRAADDVSGLVASTCADVTGPAYGFPLGTSVFTASATDAAGNTATASVSFGVVATPASVGALGLQFVRASTAYRALTAQQQVVVDRLVNSATAAVERILPYLQPAQKTTLLHAYAVTLTQLVRGGWLTQGQADTLTRLAAAL